MILAYVHTTYAGSLNCHDIPVVLRKRVPPSIMANNTILLEIR